MPFGLLVCTNLSTVRIMNETTFVCCICKHASTRDRVVKLDIRSLAESHPVPEESFFAHGSCLRDVVHEDFQLLSTKTPDEAIEILG